jgi:hypothetical protein
MITYDKPLYQTYTAHANASVSTAADIFQLTSPVPGMVGRIVGVAIVTTTATTAAASAVRVGTVADPDAFAEFAVPVALIDTSVPITNALIRATEDITADTVVLVSGSGAATAGAIDLALTVAWA